MIRTRRAIVRPCRPYGPEESQLTRRRQRLQSRLEQSTVNVARWQRRLRRAFSSVFKYQGQITRINRQLEQLSTTPRK